MDARTPLLAALVLLAGCAADPGGFPSLAHRAIEDIDPAAEPVASPAAPVRSDPAIAAFAEGERQKAVAADRAFAALVDEAAPAIARGRGAEAGSDRWTEAQVALSRVQAARGPVSDALQAIAERRTAVDDPALDAAYATVSALDAAGAARVAGFARELSPGG